ncbi:MAG: hypothetical protein WKG07_29230 [Hymenobacter sp.]
MWSETTTNGTCVPEFSGAYDSAGLLAELRAALPPTADIRLTDNHQKDIVLLVAKGAPLA